MGEFKVRSVQRDYSLKLVVVIRVRHSTVSLHSVQLLSLFPHGRK